MMKKNMKNLVMLGVLAGMLSLTSCGDNKKEKKETAEPMQNEMHEPSRTKAMTAYHDEKTEASFKDEHTGKIYQQYLDVKDALVNDNTSEAQENAKDLAETLKDTKNQDALDAAQKIAGTEDVHQQREAFSKLTAAMEPVLKGALASGEVYKLYCPMAFNGKGDYWYTNSADIHNPYMGQKMENCGRVADTIK